jgi:hypothetical protein
MEGITMPPRIMSALVAGLAAAGFVFAGAGTAKDVKIGIEAISLPSPEKYCELVEQQPSDARVLKIIGDLVAGVQNELLMVTADCTQLDAWRAGKIPALDDYAQYQTIAGAKDSSFNRAAAIKDFCATMRAEGEKSMAGMSANINARLEAAIKGAKFNEPQFLGVLAEDADACYFGLTQKLRTETGTEKTQVTISTTTIVKGKALFYNLYTVYRGDDTVSGALARQQRNVAALLAANGG